MSETNVPPADRPTPAAESSAPAAPAAPPPAVPPPSWAVQPPPRRRSGLRRVFFYLWVLVFLVSVVLNGYLIVGLAALTGADALTTSVIRPGDEAQVVAVVDVQGMIRGKHVDLIERFCRKVAKDENIKAVVLRIASGGGGVATCDRIYNRLKSIKETGKPLVVSMGDAAASGGYYIAAPADAIFAEPTTITGSIGVILAWPVIKGTLDKYGAKMVVVRSSRTRAWKAAENFFEDPAPHHLAELRKTVDAFQDRFESIVRAERGDKLKPTPEQVTTYTGSDGKKFKVTESEPFNGKIFLPERAKALGLIDEIGYFDEAVDEAARLAGLARPKVVRYARPKSLMEHLGMDAKARPPLGMDLLEDFRSPRVLAVWRITP